MIRWSDVRGRQEHYRELVREAEKYRLAQQAINGSGGYDSPLRAAFVSLRSLLGKTIWQRNAYLRQVTKAMHAAWFSLKL